MTAEALKTPMAATHSGTQPHPLAEFWSHFTANAGAVALMEPIASAHAPIKNVRSLVTMVFLVAARYRDVASNIVATLLGKQAVRHEDSSIGGVAVFMAARESAPPSARIRV